MAEEGSTTFIQAMAKEEKAGYIEIKQRFSQHFGRPMTIAEKNFTTERVSQCSAPVAPVARPCAKHDILGKSVTPKGGRFKKFFTSMFASTDDVVDEDAETTDEEEPEDGAPARLSWFREFSGSAEWWILKEKVKLGKLIGRGAAGDVFEATLDGVTIAAKRFMLPVRTYDEFDCSGDFINEVKREASALAHMHHPNILQFHGMTVDEEYLYLLQERMAFSLDGLLFDSSPAMTLIRARLTAKAKHRILLQVSAGMSYLHARGLLHRDLKPANVLCSSNLDVIKVADFGSSTKIKNLNRATLELTTNLGTPMYMVRGTPVYTHHSPDCSCSCSCCWLYIYIYAPGCETPRPPHRRLL